MLITTRETQERRGVTLRAELFNFAVPLAADRVPFRALLARSKRKIDGLNARTQLAYLNDENSLRKGAEVFIYVI